MPNIPEGRQRYSVTLTAANVGRFRSLCRSIKLPSTTMSALCDDAISGMCEVLQTAKDQGTIGLNDIFRLMGKTMELAIEEERRERATYKERVVAADGSKVA